MEYDLLSKLTDTKLGRMVFTLIGLSPILVYTPLLVYVESFHTLSSLSKYVPEYLIFYHHLPTAIQIIFGLMGVVTIFYLGKSHDYIKEFVKYQSRLYGVIVKLKRTHVDKGEKIREEFFDKLDKEILIYESLGNHVSKSRKLIISLFLGDTLTFGYVLFMALNEPRTIEIIFVKLALTLLMGIAQFLIFWYLYESVMSLHESTLGMISKKVEEYEAFF